MADFGKRGGPDFQSLSAAEKSRRAEKKASAKLRGRQSFDDQSKVEKIYTWIKENYEVPSYDAAARYMWEKGLEETKRKLDAQKKNK